METKRGSCHCGAVEFEVDLEDGLQELRRCNCSLCRRKGTVMATVPLERIRVVQGSDNLGLYQWNTNTAEHYFCNTCGIYTHHRKRTNPGEYGFNIACLEDIDPFSLKDILIVDGASLS